MEKTLLKVLCVITGIFEIIHAIAMFVKAREI